MSFDVKVDQTFKEYLTQTGLEIFVFDDSAPLLGTEQWDDITDMIGTAVVDLTPLMKGEAVQKSVLIKDLKNWDCGSISVLISIKDKRVVWKQKVVEYSPEWEDEFIFKCCVELVKQIRDPTLEKAFDALAKGWKSIYYDDFVNSITKWYRVDVTE